MRTNRRAMSGESRSAARQYRPPSEFPTRYGASIPSASTYDVRNRAMFPTEYTRSGGAPVDPAPGRSGAITRYRAERGPITYRHEYDDVINPCTTTSGGPVPATL